MCAKAVEGRFVTFVLIILDTINHTMSARERRPHVARWSARSDGTIEEFDEASVGVPIGVMEGFQYDAAANARSCPAKSS